MNSLITVNKAKEYNLKHQTTCCQAGQVKPITWKLESQAKKKYLSLILVIMAKILEMA